MSNIIHKHRYALLTGCAIVAAAIATSAARAGKDGVVFDNVFATNTDNG